MRILLVDDHPVIHEVMQAMLARALKPEAIYVASNFEEAIERASSWIDLVVLDLGLPGYTGIQALESFRKRFPALDVVVLSAIESSNVICAALEVGARGFIPKTSTADVMIAAFRLVASGRIYVPPKLLRGTPDGWHSNSAKGLDSELTIRELDVLHQLVQGLPNRQIARKLYISENTVKQHTRSIFRVLAVGNRTEALIAAARRGIKIV